MTDMRKVIITIETKTSIPHKELMQLQSLVFGVVRRKNSQARDSRKTIKREMPRWVGHDVFGTIEQVQVNVVDKKRGKRKSA